MATAHRQPPAERFDDLPGSAPRESASASLAGAVVVSKKAALREAATRLDQLRAHHYPGGHRLRTPSSQGVELHVAALEAPTPHWALATRGLAPRGFELTLRVPKTPAESAPPAWATALLRGLARARADGQVPEVGQITSVRELLPAGLESTLDAVAFTIDSKLGQFETVHGPLSVLLAVGLTADEQRLAREWSPLGLVEVLATVDPLLLTRPERPSLLGSPRARSVIEVRAEREGSSLGVAWAAHSAVTRHGQTVTWTLSADDVDTVNSLLKGRLSHQRSFMIRSPDGQVDVHPTERCSAAVHGPDLTLRLTQSGARALRACLRRSPGTYQTDVVPDFRVEVVAKLG